MSGRAGGTVAPGEVFAAGNRLYLRCRRCDAIVRHKLMLGFFHLCAEGAEDAD